MTRDTKNRYVGRVRELLSVDLSVDDLNMLISDLEDQLSDLGAEEVERELGPPEEFVEAYRVSAGLPAESPKSPQRIAGQLNTWLDNRRDTPLGRLWLKYQPAWWLLRGLVILLAFNLAYGSPPIFRPFPVPNVNELPTTSFGVLVGFTVGSQLLARTVTWLPGRIANILVSAFAFYAAFVAAFNS